MTREDFDAFVAARSTSLLLTRDRGLAEDLGRRHTPIGCGKIMPP